MMYALLAMFDATGLSRYQQFWVGLAMLVGFFYLLGRKPKKWI